MALCRLTKTLLLSTAVSLTGAVPAGGSDSPRKGGASWYGEQHRGKLMANRKPFDPDKFTAASWFYPLGTKVRVTVKPPSRPPRSVVVTITDRGPARELVRNGRIIDLGHAPFKQLACPAQGLVAVTVQPIQQNFSATSAAPLPTHKTRACTRGGQLGPRDPR